jgi:hypothetical protein
VPLAAHELGSGEVVGCEPAEDAHGHLLRQPAPEHCALLLFISIFVNDLFLVWYVLVIFISISPQPAQHHLLAS